MRIRITGRKKIRVTGLPKAKVGMVYNTLDSNPGDPCAEDEYWDGTQCVKIRPYEQIFDTEGTVGGYDKASDKAIPLSNYGYNNRRGFYVDKATGVVMDARTGKPAVNYVAPNPKDYDSWYNTFNEDYGKDLEQFNPGIRTEAGDLLYNAGVDPRIYMLDQYIKNVEGNQAGLAGRGKFRAANKAGVWTDAAKQQEFENVYAQYKDKINALPVEQQRNLLNQGRQFYYENTNRGYWKETKDAQGNVIKKEFIEDVNRPEEMNPATKSWLQRYGLKNYSGKFKNRQDPNLSSNTNNVGTTTTTTINVGSTNTNVNNTGATPTTTTTTIDPSKPVFDGGLSKEGEQELFKKLGKDINAKKPSDVQTSDQIFPEGGLSADQEQELLKKLGKDIKRKQTVTDKTNIGDTDVFNSQNKKVGEYRNGEYRDTPTDSTQNKNRKFRYPYYYDPNQLLSATNTAAQLAKDYNDRLSAGRWAVDRGLTDRLAAPVPVNTSGKHGNYSVTGTTYGLFRYPEMGFKNEGMFYNNPGLPVRMAQYGGDIQNMNMNVQASPEPVLVNDPAMPQGFPRPVVERSSAPSEMQMESSEPNPMVEKTQEDISKLYKGIFDYNASPNTLDFKVLNVSQGNRITEKLINEANERNIESISFNRRTWNADSGWEKGGIRSANQISILFNNPETSNLRTMATGGVISDELSLPSELIKISDTTASSTPTSPSSSSETTGFSGGMMDYVLPLEKFFITSGYGPRKAPVKGGSVFHNGVDLGVPIGTNVKSPFDGVVKSIYFDDDHGGGKSLIIEHPDGSKSGYAHLNDYKVKVGDRVSKGQVIALSGNTGRSSGPHLHFTWRPSGAASAVDPRTVFDFSGKSNKYKFYNPPSNNDNRVSNWDHFNPGNIHIEGDFAKRYGATKGRKDGNGHVAVFPDMQTGLKAMNDLLFGSAYNNLTVSQARNKWVNGDPSVSNPSTPYIVKALGKDYKMSDLTPDQRRMVLNEYIKWEDRDVYSRLLKDKLIYKTGGSVSSDLTSNNMRIRITGTPSAKKMAYGGQSGYGFDLGQRNTYSEMNHNPYENSSRTLGPVPREEANIEAEKGETVWGDLDADGHKEHMIIGGKRHTEGGTPLNVPEGSFIFSDTKKMKIKDPKILKYFNLKPKAGGYTPAEIAKRYDTNKYEAILADPYADPVKKKTAELMIDSYEKKLAYLALIQEGKKGFPNGVPQVAADVIKGGQQEIDPNRTQAPLMTLAPQQPPQGEEFMEGMPQEQMAPGEEPGEEEMMMAQQQGAPTEQPPMMYGGEGYYRHGGPYIPSYQYAYGGIPMAATGLEVEEEEDVTDNPPGKKKKYKVKNKEVEAVQVEKVPSGYKPYEGVSGLYWKEGQAGSTGAGTWNKGKRIKITGKSKSSAKDPCANLLGTEEDMKKRPGCYNNFLNVSGWAKASPEERAKAWKVWNESKTGERPTFTPGTVIPGTPDDYVYMEDQPKDETPESYWQCTPNGVVAINPASVPKNVNLELLGMYKSQAEAEAVCKPKEKEKEEEKKEEEKLDYNQNYFDYGRKPFFGSQFGVPPKRYHAYAAPLAGYIPNPVFLDPSRELAENAGLAYTMAKGYTGSPQGYAATHTATQMKALDNAANIIGRTSNANVQIANTFSPLQTDIMNKLMAYQANRMDTLHHNENMYDKEYRNSLRKFLQGWDTYRKGDYEYYTKRNLMNASNPYYDLIDSPYIYPGGNVRLKPGTNAMGMITGSGAIAGVAGTATPAERKKYLERAQELKLQYPNITDKQMQPILQAEFPNIFATASNNTKTPQQQYADQYMSLFGRSSKSDDDEG